MKLYNFLTRKKEVFKPIYDKKVGFYTCGPTVYNYAHIGNLRTYIFEDILFRVLEYDGYKVKRVMNITDVGHLTSDADTGEDRVEKSAREQKKTAFQIAAFYTRAFKKDIKKLNIKEPHIWSKAADHIKEQIALIKILEKKGYTYQIEDGVYFDTSKFKDYGRLAGKEYLAGIKSGARIEMVQGKKNATDFALWKLTPAGVKRQMEWSSSWGKGFPGWHIECSAMSMKYLGKSFDIHAGAIDHLTVHHPNEIAQSEAATGKKFVNFWVEGEHLLVNGEKMAKSFGNFFTLADAEKRGINPLVFRYLVLTAHYRSPLNFTWESLNSAEKALQKVYEFSESLPVKYVKSPMSDKLKKFQKAINDDLDTPKALAITWEVIKNKSIPPAVKKFLLLEFDKILGLGIKKAGRKKIKIPADIKNLVDRRENLRANKKWREADILRQKIKKMGWVIEDTAGGPKLKHI